MPDPQERKPLERPYEYQIARPEYDSYNRLKGHCHWVVFPDEPVIGIEDRRRRDAHPYWEDAWYAARHLTRPEFSQAPDAIGLAMNPASRRGQHQLHIHIGKLPSAMRQAMNASIGTSTKWVDVRVPGDHTYKGRYVATLSNPSPMELASDTWRECNMPHASLIVAGASDGKGFYVLSHTDVAVEARLDYTDDPRSCPDSAPAPDRCVGSCNGDGTVTVADIITLVNIAQGTAEPTACPLGIPADGTVAIDVILEAVDHALGGCVD